MYKITGAAKRYFEFVDPSTGKVLLLEPPKLKTLRKMEDIDKDKNAGIGDITDLLAQIISKNKAGRKVTSTQVEEWMDLDQMQDFLAKYMAWLRNSRNNDPN